VSGRPADAQPDVRADERTTTGFEARRRWARRAERPERRPPARSAALVRALAPPCGGGYSSA